MKVKERENLPKELFVPNLRSVRRQSQGGFLMRVVAARPIKKGRIHISHINCCLTNLVNVNRPIKKGRIHIPLIDCN